MTWLHFALTWLTLLTTLHVQANTCLMTLTLRFSVTGGMWQGSVQVNSENDVTVTAQSNLAQLRGGQQGAGYVVQDATLCIKPGSYLVEVVIENKSEISSALMAAVEVNGVVVQGGLTGVPESRWQYTTQHGTKNATICSTDFPALNLGVPNVERAAWASESCVGNCSPQITFSLQISVPNLSSSCTGKDQQICQREPVTAKSLQVPNSWTVYIATSVWELYVGGTMSVKSPRGQVPGWDGSNQVSEIDVRASSGQVLFAMHTQDLSRGEASSGTMFAVMYNGQLVAQSGLTSKWRILVSETPPADGWNYNATFDDSSWTSLVAYCNRRIVSDNVAYMQTLGTCPQALWSQLKCNGIGIGDQRAGAQGNDQNLNIYFRMVLNTASLPPAITCGNTRTTATMSITSRASQVTAVSSSSSSVSRTAESVVVGITSASFTSVGPASTGNAGQLASSTTSLTRPSLASTYESSGSSQPYASLFMTSTTNTCSSTAVSTPLPVASTFLITRQSRLTSEGTAATTYAVTRMPQTSANNIFIVTVASSTIYNFTSTGSTTRTWSRSPRITAPTTQLPVEQSSITSFTLSHDESSTLPIGTTSMTSPTASILIFRTSGSDTMNATFLTGSTLTTSIKTVSSSTAKQTSWLQSTISGGSSQATQSTSGTNTALETSSFTRRSHSSVNLLKSSVSVSSFNIQSTTRTNGLTNNSAAITAQNLTSPLSILLIVLVSLVSLVVLYMLAVRPHPKTLASATMHALSQELPLEQSQIYQSQSELASEASLDQ